MAGPECCVPAPPSEHSSTGSEATIGTFFSYISQPATPPQAAVILASDVFGFQSTILRKLADKIASRGYFVVVPDYFGDDPFNPNVERTEWLQRHNPVDAVGGTRNVIESIRNKGISSVGAVGFCWGAKVVVELAKEDDLKAAILCHPSRVSIDDIKEVKTPIAILAAETDKITPPALVMEFQEILDSKKEVESFVRIYPGTTHGWVVRYDVSNAQEVANAEEAHLKIFEFLAKFLQ